MADLLGSIKGRFLMSINDVPEVRDIFGGFKMQEVTTSYTISKHNDSRGKEPSCSLGILSGVKEAVT